MRVAVAITRTDLNATGLRLAAKRCRDASPALRILALAPVLEGASRADAARACGMDQQRCATGCIATTPKAWMA